MATRRILFVTSNGTGLGHLTRSMATARRLDPRIEPLVVTFSAAAPVVEQMGLPVEYVASYDRPGAGTDISWTRRARDRLRLIVADARPDIVVFDGTHPYERLLPALRSSGAPLVWCRRAMWRAEADTAPLHRTHLFDAVLEPGEIAAEADHGPTTARRDEAHRIEPIVLLDRSDLLPRGEAVAELGLDPDRLHALVQLGQGDGVREANLRAAELLARRPDVQVAMLASHLAALPSAPDGVVALSATYPISRYLAAFDMSVAAAGYNVFHELIALGVPSLFVPMRRETDDQAARSRWAAGVGLAEACEGPADPGLAAALERLLDDERRTAIAENLASLVPPQGAAQAAAWLGGLADAGAIAAASNGHGRAGRPAAPADRGTTLRRSARRNWIFARSVPATAQRISRQALRRPRVKVIALALGNEAETGADLAAVANDMASTYGCEPANVIVISDRLAYSELLAAGAGFEHLPGRDSRQAELAGGAYEDFAAARVETMLARRPRGVKLVAVGSEAAAVAARSDRA